MQRSFGMETLMVVAGVWSLSLFCQPLGAQITGGMLDPAMDPDDEPFSYYWLAPQ